MEPYIIRLRIADLIIDEDKVREYPLDVYKKLKTSIKEHGVMNPIIITESKKLLSGYHRVKACKELGIKIIYCQVVPDSFEEEFKIISSESTFLNGKKKHNNET